VTLISNVNRLKLVLAVLGLATFFYSVRINSPTVRWVGIALVAVAWGLRFVRRPEPDDQLPSEMR